ncbi:MAG: 2-amino-4-hydroxy-6-hydroxymethyldihydropteridine diphosphokinase [Alistipes sp.]
MARVVLLTGGNSGDMSIRLQEAKELIQSRIGVVTLASSYYKSPPWGFDSPTLFMNQALVVETSLNPEELLQRTQQIECMLGRDHNAEQLVKLANGARYADRPMDIDILFYDDCVITRPNLLIPHPGIPGREYVLIPLSEIMGNYRHPLIGRTIGELLEDLKRHEPKL